MQPEELYPLWKAISLRITHLSDHEKEVALRHMLDKSARDVELGRAVELTDSTFDMIFDQAASAE